MLLAYQRENEPVTIVAPSQQALETMSIQEIAEASIVPFCEYIVIKNDSLPQDHTTADAWDIVNGAVVVNTDKLNQTGD